MVSVIENGELEQHLEDVDVCAQLHHFVEVYKRKKFGKQLPAREKTLTKRKIQLRCQSEKFGHGNQIEF